MIAVDWGTTSLRAYRLDPEGRVAESRQSPLGVRSVPPGRFAETLESQIGGWSDKPVVLSGMVGSRDGWLEVPYVSTPAGLHEIAAGMRTVAWADRAASIVPGLVHRAPDGVPDVIRGEETQILGVLDALPKRSWVCLPGTHSKWVEVADRRIIRFVTFVTGDLFTAIKEGTLLVRGLGDDPIDREPFLAGVRRARETGGLTHHLFGVRARSVTNELLPESTASYLSGILIGHELETARTLVEGQAVFLIGESSLVNLYQAGLGSIGIDQVTVLDGASAAAGAYALLHRSNQRS